MNTKTATQGTNYVILLALLLNLAAAAWNVRTPATGAQAAHNASIQQLRGAAAA